MQLLDFAGLLGFRSVPLVDPSAPESERVRIACMLKFELVPKMDAWVNMARAKFTMAEHGFILPPLPSSLEQEQAIRQRVECAFGLPSKKRKGSPSDAKAAKKPKKPKKPRKMTGCQLLMKIKRAEWLETHTAGEQPEDEHMKWAMKSWSTSSMNPKSSNYDKARTEQLLSKYNAGAPSVKQEQIADDSD